MKFLKPIQRVAYKETLHFVAAVIKHTRAPAFVLFLKFVGGFVAAGAVKIYQSLRVLAEVRRNPVQNYAYTSVVKGIDKVPQIVGRAVTACRRVKTRHLVSPGRVQRMLGKRHKFHMCVAHFFDVWHKVLCQVTVTVHMPVVMSAPTACMHFVNVYRGFVYVLFALFCRPIIVRPHKFFRRIVNHAGCLGAKFATDAVRVGFVQHVAALRSDCVLVTIAVLGFKRNLPYAVVPHHCVVVDKPIVEVADY